MRTRCCLVVGVLVASLSCLVGLSSGQAYADYTTNVYGRTPFLCYTCTNNYDAANSRNKFYPFSASEDCGFNYAFNPNGQYVQKTPCYTYCMKKETGIVGSRIDVERRCEPTCQEYDGSPRMPYLVDRVSCCVGNYCNKIARLESSTNMISLLAFAVLASSFMMVMA